MAYREVDGALPESLGEKPAVYAEFFMQAVADEAASETAGQVVYKDIEWCRMSRIGSNGTTTEDAVARLRRNPQLWPYLEPIYTAWRRGEDDPVSGTRVDMAPFLTAAQVAALKRINVRSVEDLATLPDAMLSSIGMGAQAMRQKAQAWLSAAHDIGKTAGKLGALEAENASLRESVDELRKLIADLTPQKPQQQPAQHGKR